MVQPFFSHYSCHKEHKKRDVALFYYGEGLSTKFGILLLAYEKYQKKFKKVTKLIDIVTPALVVFERVISGALKNGVIDEEEFNTLQTLHLETLNELTGVDRRMEAENRSLVEKSLMEEIKELKKIKEQAFNCLLSLLFRMLL